MGQITTNIQHSFYEKFGEYNEQYQKQLDALKEKYSHISAQKLAYWQFCVESQKRACCYRKSKVMFNDSTDEHKTAIQKQQAYEKLFQEYYTELDKIVLAPTFNDVVDMETFFEYKFTEYDYYDEKTEVIVNLPDKIINFSIDNAEYCIDSLNKYKDQYKLDAISAFSRFGIARLKDPSTETRMTNIYIQPIHLFHDNVTINVDLNLTAKKLNEYILGLKRKFNELSDEAKVMPSELLKRNMVNAKKNKFIPINTDVAVKIYSADESEYLRLLLMYDGLLIGMSKSATSTLIAQALQRKSGEAGNRVNSDTQKFYMDAVALMTNDLYISQCVLLQKLKHKNLPSF